MSSFNWTTDTEVFRAIAERERLLEADIAETHPPLRRPEHVSRHDVVYLRENADWIYGLPFGNGDVGGVVCFDSDLHLYLDKVDLWYDIGLPETGSADSGHTGIDHYDQVRGGRVHAGVFTLAIPWLTDCDSIEQRLDLLRGRIVVTATKESFTIRVSVAAHALENRIRVLVAHPPTISLFPHLTNFACDEREHRGQYCMLSRRLGTQEYRIEIDRKIIDDTHTAYDIAIVTSTERAGAAGARTGRAGTEGPGTEGAGTGLAEAARTLLDSAWDENGHLDWWREFWSRSSVALPDQFIENEWYLCRYITAITNRARYPSSFFGLWDFEEPVRMWGDLYVTDAQHPMALWSVMPCNDLELIGPFLELYRDLQEALEETTREVLAPGSSSEPLAETRRYFLGPGERNRGFAMPKFVWPPWTGIDHPDHGLGASMLRGESFTVAGAWIAKLFWQFFRHTGDEEFLRAVAYPFMKSALLYIECTASRDERGRIYDTSESPEQHGNTASSFGRGLTRMLLTDTIEAAAALDVDIDDRRRWQETLDSLAPYPIAEDGGVAESYVHDHPFRAHMSVLAGVYPAAEIGREHPLAPAVRSTLETATEFYANRDPGHGGLIVGSGRGGTSPGGAELNIFNQTMIALALVRMGDGGAARDHLYNPTFRYLLLPHGGWAHNPGHRGRICAETTGLPALGLIVNEMLVQLRDDGVVELFPAVPADWPDVAFSRLRVEGGLVISGAMRDGEVRWVKLSAAYDTSARLRNPFAGQYAVCRSAADHAAATESTAAAEIHVDLVRGETVTLYAGAQPPRIPWDEAPSAAVAPRWFTLDEADERNPVVVAPKPPPHEVQDFGDGRKYIGMPPVDPVTRASWIADAPSRLAAAFEMTRSHDWRDRQRGVCKLVAFRSAWMNADDLATRFRELAEDHHELVRCTAVSAMKYLRDREDVRETLARIAESDELEAGRRARWILAGEPEDSHR